LTKKSLKTRSELLLPQTSYRQVMVRPSRTTCRSWKLTRNARIRVSSPDGDRHSLENRNLYERFWWKLSNRTCKRWREHDQGEHERDDARSISLEEDCTLVVGGRDDQEHDCDGEGLSKGASREGPRERPGADGIGHWAARRCFSASGAACRGSRSSIALVSACSASFSRAHHLTSARHTGTRMLLPRFEKRGVPVDSPCMCSFLS
jgi:hypothetical protein